MPGSLSAGAPCHGTHRIETYNPFFFWIQALGRVSLWLSFVCVTLSVLGVYYLMLWRIRAVEAQLPFERMDDARHLREIFGFTPLLASDAFCATEQAEPRRTNERTLIALPSSP